MRAGRVQTNPSHQAGLGPFVREVQSSHFDLHVKVAHAMGIGELEGIRGAPDIMSARRDLKGAIAFRGGGANRRRIANYTDIYRR